MRFIVLALLSFAMVGCANDGGVSPMGAHAKEDILSNNGIEGLYLFKWEMNTNNITVNSKGDARIGL